MIWKKFFNSQTETVTGAAIILGATTLASRLLGFIRDRVLAHYFGAGDIVDVYYAAFKIPDLAYNLIILGAFSAGFIPIFSKLFNRSFLKNKKDEAWRLVNNAINTLGIFLIFLTIILIILAPLLVPLIAPGFSEEKLTLTIKMTRVMLLSPLLLGLSTVVGAVLQSLKNFFIYSLSPMMYNVGIIIGAVIFVPLLGNAGLAWGVILGALLHFLIQLPSLFHAGYAYFWLFNFKDKNLLNVIKLIIPRTLGLAAGQLNAIVMTVFASTLAVGSVAVYNYAFNLQSLPLGLIGISFAVAAFPTLSELAAKGDKEKIISTFSSTTRQILFFTIPLMILFLMLRAQIVRVVLGTGAFDWDATIKTSDTLAFFTLSLFAQSLIPLLARSFYALEDTITPFISGLISVGLNIIVAWQITKGNFGVEGLALAFSLGNLVNFILLWVLLRIRLKNLDETNILPAVYKMSAAAILMGLTVQALKQVGDVFLDTHTFLGILSQALLAGLGGLIIYILVGLLLKNKEMQIFINVIKKRLIRRPAVALDVSEINK
ncbi:MAG: Integral membrane protein MviN [Candidatus Magasanikbacteria bacterium GW2011_GWC2_40_17]|uniref:Probable lipid II flippase MurJ n=1 Tax=Candidatus Magasanikbacteria bacterium GW2011_GWA2_42_32 TaxID=1619039 RepID=A0A0G1D4F9_9BACT|nr:MAG: Integral membrane protein MviN [Candidatus Magasanikbacteria bacterium GW2011_GWC2_40_17]KKS56918.1 MAG: Integral membrane protein MviN [Candidatus Magasanikbacteria bacterium GW2011_GWA2_42_32]OGH85512.1 MAG: murein biosynthesis integral membrane protein MurJ [Candidatus Magasanikbacteria bacterium RIFOXYB2_FULL_38_10]